MTEGSRYTRIIEWSDIDNCFIGSCPELFFAGCHGDDEHAVFDELCRIIEETIELYRKNGKKLPPPLAGKELANALQKVV